MSLETYLLYLSAVGVFFATPPDTSQLLIVSNSIRHGLLRSAWTVAGDLSANLLQMTAAAFGLAAVIASSAEAFLWIKWGGVAYLCWIGVRLMLARPEAATKEAPTTGGVLRLYRQGFVTSMANPLAVVFFGALFPQFIEPTAPVLPQLALLSGTYLVIDGLLLLAWGWLGTRAAAMVRGASLRTVNRICGALMVAAAGLLAGKDLEPAR